MKILIVEDDPTSRRALVRILAHEGHDAVGVETAREAVLACHRRCPDLLILDYQLPDATGLDVLEQVHAACPAGAPAVLVTGQALGPRSRRRAERRGVAILRKPLSTTELLARVRSARRPSPLA